MKRYSMFLAMAVMLLALVTTGCKVGEDDPFISLNSRNSRITGTWTLSGLEGSAIAISVSGSNTTTNTLLRSFDGTSLNVSGVGGGFSYTYSEQLEINQDGTYRRTRVSDGYEEIREGSWWWLDDTKDQARIAFDNNDITSMDILQLKKKEVIFVTHIYEKDVFTSVEYNEYTHDETLTYTKE